MLYIKRKKKTTIQTWWPPPHRARKMYRKYREKNKSKLWLPSLFHASWIYISTCHSESTSPFLSFFRIRSQICTHEIKAKLNPLKKEICYKPNCHIKGLLFESSWWADMKSGSPVDAVGGRYHRSDQYEGHALEQTPAKQWNVRRTTHTWIFNKSKTFFLQIHSITIWPFFVAF